MFPTYWENIKVNENKCGEVYSDTNISDSYLCKQRSSLQMLDFVFSGPCSVTHKLQRTQFSAMGSLHSQLYSFMKISTEGSDRLAYQKLSKFSSSLVPSAPRQHFTRVQMKKQYTRSRIYKKVQLVLQKSRWHIQFRNLFALLADLSSLIPQEEFIILFRIINSGK